jgi:protein O-GlcNAc transferase
MMPNNATDWHRIGLARWHQGRRDGAIEALRTALGQRPDDVEVMMDLGVMLSHGGDVDEAVETFRRVMEQRPRWTEPLINIGNTLRNWGRLGGALEAYREAIALEPGHVVAHHLLGSALGRHGLREESRAHYLEALRLAPSDGVVHSSLLYLMGYEPGVDPAVRLNEHVWWDRLHGQGLVPARPHGNDRSPHRRLRVGYVSADFRTHAVARFILPIYEAHSRREFEIHSYANMERFDAISERFRELSDGWHITFGLADSSLADLIRADEIDILVDLSGHTTGNRLEVFCLRPAPLQVSYFGYPHTTGIRAIQYRLTDGIMDPPGERSSHTEELLRLPGAWCCWKPQPAPQVTVAPCLENGFFTFGGIHNPLKINDDVVDLWSKVLHAVPGARLRLFRDTLNDVARRYFERKFLDRGIEPSRLELGTAAVDGIGHLDEYSKMDVSLDTQPWTGNTSTCESLWMGVPTLTLRGSQAAGRQSATALTAVGLNEFIAETPEDFVDLAVRWADRPRQIAKLRAELRGRVERSPLCDAETFTRHLEAAYRQIWQRWATQASDDAHP